MSTTSSRSKAYLGGLLLLSSIALLTGCALDDPQSTFDTVGPVSQSQLMLFYWIFGAAVVVFIVVGAVLAYTSIRFRRKSPDDNPPQTHGNTPMEIGWTIVPVLLLAVVAVPTVMTIFDNANSPDPGALTVEAVGRQWWFEFRYPHPTDPDEQVVTANELHIPVGEVVNINLESRDRLLRRLTRSSRWRQRVRPCSKATSLGAGLVTRFRARRSREGRWDQTLPTLPAEASLPPGS
jgi:cytochrome c oxidase subunit 2